MKERIARFLAVGAIGFGLQIGAMALFTAVLGWPYLLATVLAVEAAVLHNFRWHERWTWGDRTAAESGVRLRLLRYHLTTGATSAAGNLLLTAVSVEGLGLHPVPANVAAVACLGAVNFLVADRWVFDRQNRRQGSAAT